jgi:hypothetical protein
MQAWARPAHILFPLYLEIHSVVSPSVPGSNGKSHVPNPSSILKSTNNYSTGRYKPPTILSSLSAILCFSLLLTFWRGHTSTTASLVIFFGGCASGMANSAVFVGLTAGVEKEQMAIATTGLYLSSNISVVAGVSAASAIFQSALRANLHRILERVVDGDEVCLVMSLLEGTIQLIWYHRLRGKC